METIVIVGGGAGGLELATYLGNKLGRKQKAKVVLIDRNATHLWKPLLHEVATGTIDEGTDALSYRAHAKNHSFEFQQGTLVAVDERRKRFHSPRFIMIKTNFSLKNAISVMTN